MREPIHSLTLRWANGTPKVRVDICGERAAMTSFDLMTGLPSRVSTGTLDELERAVTRYPSSALSPTPTEPQK